MADVKVSGLASVVGVSVERLLFQIKEAGLPHTGPDEAITNEDKNTLLLFLRRGHGDKNATDAAPSKITLKRKTIATLKSAPSHGRSKTVSVEVRKKRTYVKRSTLPGEAPSNQAGAEEEIMQAVPAVEVKTDAVAAASPAKDEKSEAAAETGAVEAKDSKSAPKITEIPMPEVPGPAADNARGGKLGDKRRGKSAEDDRDEEKKSHIKHREKALRRQTKDRLTPDEFVLQDGEYEQIDSHVRRGGRKQKREKQHAFEKPTEFISRAVAIGEANVVSELAQKMSVKSDEIIKQLLKMGVMATVNQLLDRDTATLVIEEMGNTAKYISEDVVEEKLSESLAQEEGKEEITRAPVVTVMGHVDHGKTSLLDYIRKASVASGEAGGITQHIGAYHVKTDKGMVCFLDTPGHAAFSAMRSRGAKATDIVILVVAADDGVKPQTEEAVQHAKAANVPIVVAINKMDKHGADPERVRNELSAKNVVPDSWGGDTQFIEVSALTGKGVDDLLEAVLLQAELLELKAFVDVPGRGLVIESRLDKGRGPIATVLVQNGTLRTGDIVLVGHETGRVRALLDASGNAVDSAGPSMPVEILGLTGVPEAGDDFVVVSDEKYAREIAEHRRERFKERQHALKKTGTLESMFAGIGKEDKKILNVVIKADVRGSLEALSSSLQKIGNDEVEVNIVAIGVGGFSETDAQLAATSNAMMIGFNVRADKAARDLVEKEGLELRYYSVIYNVIDDAKAILSGMLKPELREEILGVAEVRDVFNSPKYGQIAGCMVVEGTVFRSKPIRVLRENVVIYEGELESLRRFKDDAGEVRNGMECGIGVKNYNDVKAGDRIEVFQTKEVARSL